MAAKIKSSRKPLLRIIGSDRETTRHAVVMEINGVNVVVEVWTPAEYDQLEAWERPDKTPFFMPGIGFIHAREAQSYLELVDIQDVSYQARAEWLLLQGQA